MKIFYKITCIAALLLAATSCSIDWKTEAEYPFKNERTGETPTFTFTGDREISVVKTGGSFNGVFTANLPWTAESLADWISITSDKRGNGGDDAVTLTFDVSRNSTLKPRSGKIRVKITDDAEAYIVLNQEQSLPEDLGNDWYIKPGGTGDGSSWEKAIDLGPALAACATADKLYLAAGTYTPTQFAGGTTDVYRCFLLSQNVWIYGGYPENPVAGDQADPAKNKTILSGKNGNYHNLVVAVPEDDIYQVHIDGLIFQDSNNTCSSAGSQKINGVNFYMTYGAAVYIAGSKGEMTNCVITDNQGSYVPGLWLTPKSYWSVDKCSFTKNTNISNYGSAIHNAGTVIVKNSVITGNVCSKGSGPAIYNYDLINKSACEAYFYNCYIADNECSNKIVGRPGAIYCRENSRTVFVNCTIANNNAGNAPLYFYGTASVNTQGYVISTTITGNTSTVSGVCGGIGSLSSTVNVYNSVVSGNICSNDGVADLSAWGTIKANKTAKCSHTISGKNVFGDDTVVSSSFDPATMIGALSGNVYPLIGTGNPAKTDGMSGADLKGISTGYVVELDKDLVAKDQKGNDRSGKVMGAYVGL